MISATVIASSYNAGNRIVTFELEYPRFIHAEFMTHRMLSKNAASSRAIPVKRAIELVQENTARPIHWGKNEPGMSASEECNEHVWGLQPNDYLTRDGAWNFARDQAIQVSRAFDKAGYHKQIVNRLTEPFAHIKVVATGTDFGLDNLYWLRRHPAAQPEFQELANKMYEAEKEASQYVLEPGCWHVPYFHDGFWKPDTDVRLEDALAISASCCAQVSYRRSDDSLEKAYDIWKKLVGNPPVHASPFEHQATPICPQDDNHWDDGITHRDRRGGHWSANFKGWIQHRQLIQGHNYEESLRV